MSLCLSSLWSGCFPHHLCWIQIAEGLAGYLHKKCVCVLGEKGKRNEELNMKLGEQKRTRDVPFSGGRAMSEHFFDQTLLALWELAEPGCCSALVFNLFHATTPINKQSERLWTHHQSCSPPRTLFALIQQALLLKL